MGSVECFAHVLISHMVLFLLKSPNNFCQFCYSIDCRSSKKNLVKKIALLYYVAIPETLVLFIGKKKLKYRSLVENNIMKRRLCFVPTCPSLTISCSQNQNNPPQLEVTPPRQTPARQISRRAFTTIATTIATSLIIPPNQHTAAADSKSSNQSWQPIKDFWQKSFAHDMDSGMREYEENIEQRKRQLFSLITTPNCTIVDIGIGTGPNLRYYPTDSHVIGIEPNIHMWPYARRQNSSLQSLEFKVGKSENLPLSNACCDVVVTTLTLCSVTDVTNSLNEIVRVLKPGGLFIFVEHVIADPKNFLLRTLQYILNPLQQVVSDGCHLNRDTAHIIETVLQNKMSEIHIDKFDADFGGPVEDSISPIRPHIAGYARKQL